MQDTVCMNKNDRLEVNIEGYTSEGAGVAKPGGYVLFIPNTVKGERVLAHVTKAGKSFGYARALEILEPSKERVVPPCPVSSACGGCELLHMSYAQQLDFKREKVVSALRKAGVEATVGNTVHSPSVHGYRNKAQYPIREKDGVAVGGFYRRGSHTVIEASCLITPRVFDDILRTLLSFINRNGIKAYNENTLTGSVRHLYLRSSADLKSIMVCIVVNGQLDKKMQLCDVLKVQFPEISTICINYNDKNTNVVLGDKYEVLCGSGEITDVLCGKEFGISPAAFYQVNHDGCEKLYGLVREYARAEGKKVLDLYCGIGTIGICAADNARELVGVEIVEAAVINARQNAVRNGLTNARFITGDAGTAVKEAGHGFDVIIVDPPRKGCDTNTLSFLIDEKPQTVVYVSCDPATLARDLRVLEDGGYSIEKVTPVDMFPNTKHVETVVLLKAI